MKTIKIEIDYNNLDSIEQAEKTKTRLENKGYKVFTAAQAAQKSILFAAPYPLRFTAAQAAQKFDDYPRLEVTRFTAAQAA